MRLSNFFFSFGLMLFVSLFSAEAGAQTEKEEVKTLETESWGVGELAEPEPDKSNEPKAYEFVDEQAEFPGGMTALMKHIQDTIIYPDAAIDLGLQGKVYVEFVVFEDGSIDRIRILRSPDQILSDEAIRVVKTFPKMTPGKLNGKAVASVYRIPFSFVLPEKTIEKKN
jgi:TonB family protein